MPVQGPAGSCPGCHDHLETLLDLAVRALQKFAAWRAVYYQHDFMLVNEEYQLHIQLGKVLAL